MRGTIRIQNFTQRLEQGGSVHLLDLDSRMEFPADPGAMSQAQWLDFADHIRAHPRTRIMSGSVLDRTLGMNLKVTDDTEYNGFTTWKGSGAVGDFWSTVGVWPGYTPAQRPMSTLVMVFDATSTVQTYMVEAFADFYTRWPTDTMQSSLQHAVPTAAPAALNLSR
jgi:hypothetical protein